jgi:hypothetical protein
MQKLFELSGHPNWEIRSTRLTTYIGTCKDCLSDQDIPTEKSEALDSHAMLEHAKVVWVIRSWHPNWEIRGTGLTYYVRTCNNCLSDQDILTEKSEALDSQPMLEYAKVVWVIRISQLRNQRHWTHILCWNMQRLFEWSGPDIPTEKSEALDSHTMLEHAKIVWVIRTSQLRNQRH